MQVPQVEGTSVLILVEQADKEAISMYKVDSPISTNGKITATPIQLSEGTLKFTIDLKESNK